MHHSPQRRSWLVEPLSLILVLGPGLASTARAQSTGIPPQPTPVETTTFHAYGGDLGFEGDDGFRVAVEGGEFRHRGHRHLGGVGRIESPWGEEMPVRYWFNSDGSFGIEYDGNAAILYGFDLDGRLDQVTVATPQTSRTVQVGSRAERYLRGELGPWELDLEPYEVLLQQIASNHSPAFLEGVERLHAGVVGEGLVAPAGCATDALECSLAVLGWIGSFPAIAAACTVGGVLTLGAGCLAAIIGHEVASGYVITQCANAILNCGAEDSRHDPGDGCNGPGHTDE